MKIILFFIITLIVKCNSRCHTTKQSAVRCTTIEDVKEAGPQNFWEEIDIEKHNSYSPKQTIVTNLFRDKPNVKKITFKNSVNSIEKNAFKGASLLNTLSFYDCAFPVIKNFWFYNIPVKQLTISNSNVGILESGCFSHVPELKRLTIKDNILSRIPAGVFNHTNIESLYLSYNGIVHIDDGAFFGMTKLQRLGLDGNKLTSFQPHLYIGDQSRDLSVLWLFKNNIKRIVKNNFKFFPNLRIIMLHQNELQSLQIGAFDNVPYLSYLDISNNYLEYIGESVFPDKVLSYMDIFFIHNNRLTYLPTDIFHRFPSLTKVAIGGNPWQCACYMQIVNVLKLNDVQVICDDEYFLGGRPVCIVPDERPTTCVENITDVNRICEKYFNTLANYKPLLPICRLSCNDSKPCYSDDFTRLGYKPIEEPS